MESEKDISIEYEELKKEFGLPNFDRLAEDFDIEKISEKETSFLMREIRRAINEKLSAYLHLFETLINPTSPPMFVFSLLKNVSLEDKEKIKEIYKKLSKLQVKVMKLDTNYSESGEAEFVNNSFGEWQEIKPEIMGLIEKFETGFEENGDSRKNGYFG